MNLQVMSNAFKKAKKQPAKTKYLLQSITNDNLPETAASRSGTKMPPAAADQLFTTRASTLMQNNNNNTTLKSLIKAPHHHARPSSIIDRSIRGGNADQGCQSCHYHCTSKNSKSCLDKNGENIESDDIDAEQKPTGGSHRTSKNLNTHRSPCRTNTSTGLSHSYCKYNQFNPFISSFIHLMKDHQ